MSVAQFLLPGESVLYEAPDEVYYRRTPFALYVTGERLLLYAVTGRLSPSERAVAEPLAGVESVEYSETGLLSTRGRLDVRFLTAGAMFVLDNHIATGPQPRRAVRAVRCRA